MRVTSSMYYESLYGKNNNLLNQELFDVNRQIASGLKIEYAKDDVAAFTETMRLDNEIVTLAQTKQSTESGYKVSNQTDVVLNEFEDSINRIRTLLIQASNGANSVTSRDAIAKELRGVEEGLKNLSNTSINGQYLFSGSAVDVKPISDDGTYNGNDIPMGTFSGSHTSQKYNLTGAELFLGEEKLVRRTISSNVVQTLNASSSDSNLVSTSSTMSEFMGDVSSGNTHYFYASGVRSDGSSFKEQIQMADSETVDGLLDKIGNIYGNTPNLKLVNVSLNSSGSIEIEDKIQGSSKLDFHMIGAVDFSGGDAADIVGVPGRTIDDLDAGTTDYNAVAATPGLYIKEFNKSPYTSAVAGGTTNDAILYDRTNFEVDGAILTSGISQIVKDGNAFATSSTKISEVADITKGTTTTADDTLDGSSLKLVGTDINGSSFDVEINFSNSGSTFSTDGGTTSYDIFNVASTRAATPADDVTYQQIMDIMNIVATSQTGALLNNATGDDALEAEAYDTAIKNASLIGETSLTYDGKIRFGDLNNVSTKATIAMYDKNSGDFNADASIMSFNSNNAITIRDPKTDFFKNIDEMINSVENHILYPDSSAGNMRSVGMENAVTMLDDLQDHLSRSHATVGAQSNALTQSIERIELLDISTQSLRSSVIDTDVAEASLRLSQLSLNYQAMLSTVGKVSKLSLVNYL